MMFFIAFQLLIICVRNPDYFSMNGIRYIDLPEMYKSPSSRFGFKMLFDQQNDRLIVSAPESMSEEGNISAGGVFTCPFSNEEIKCNRTFSLPKENILKQDDRFRPFFGYNMDLDNLNNIWICAPNIPSKMDWTHYCYGYQKDGKSLLLGLLRRFVGENNKRITENFGTIFKFYQSPTSIGFLVGSRLYNLNESPYNKESFKETFSVYKHFDEKRLDLEIVALSNYKIFLNPVLNSRYYLIVTYPTYQNMKGYFAIFGQDFKLIRQVQNVLGTAGQFFGYDGLYIDLNNDKQSDLLLTAPFKSESFQEGGAFFYLFDNSNQHFSAKPIVLDGSNEINALFGLSVASLGDINYDNFGDIAILAPYMDAKTPKLFIYFGAENGLKNTIGKIIDISRVAGIESFHPFSLFSKFDFNHDQIDDLIVSFPNEDRLVILRGLKISKLQRKNLESNKIKLDNINEYCPEIDGKPSCGLFHQENMKMVYFTTNFAADYLKRNLTLIVKLKTKNPETLQFLNDEGKPLPEITLKKAINEKFDEIDVQFLIIFSFKVGAQDSAEIASEAFVVNDIEECLDYCVDNDVLEKSDTIVNYVYECASKLMCQDNFTITENQENSKDVPIGTLHNGEMKLNLKNDQNVTVYQTLICLAPDSSFTIKEIVIQDIPDYKYVKSNGDSLRTDPNTYLTVFQKLNPEESLNLVVLFNINASEVSPSTHEFSLFAWNGIGKINNKSLYSLTYLSKNIHKLDIYFSNNPKIISIDSNDQNKNENTEFYVVTEITNQGPSIVQFLTLTFSISVEKTDKKGLLEFVEMKKSDFIQVIKCENYADIFINKPCNSDSYLVENIPANTKISLISHWKINSKMINNITEDFKIKTSVLITDFDLFTLESKDYSYHDISEIKFLASIPLRKLALWPIIVAAVIAVLLIIIILIILWKCKVFEKLKFKKPEPVEGEVY